MMKRSKYRYTWPGETGQNLLMIIAKMSVPPVLPPRDRIRPMPIASTMPPMTGTRIFSSRYSRWPGRERSTSTFGITSKSSVETRMA